MSVAMKEVEGKWTESAGEQVVMSQCPNCGAAFGLSGYDPTTDTVKHVCRGCWQWCRVTAPAKPELPKGAR